MLGDALSYPSNGDDWLKTILIGGGLLLTSGLIIPMFILYGYTIRVLRSAAKDEDTPPSFEGWDELVIDGLKMFGISIGYLIIPYAISIISVFIGRSSMVLLLFSSLLLIVAGYTLPVAMTNFALTGDVKAAFELRQIVNAAFTTRYFISVVLALVVGGVLSIIAGLLSLLLVGLPLLFYVLIVINYLYGQGCGSMLQTGSEDREQVSGPSSPAR